MTNAIDTRPYRPNVGIMLLNTDGKVWVGSRLDMQTQHYQMPQGGVDDGENLTEAMWRELNEEISVTKHNAQIIDYHQEWVLYDLPYDISLKFWNGKYRGQKQIWYVLRLTSDDSIININTPNPEFKNWKWVDVNELCTLIIPFKKNVYKQIVNDFKHLCVPIEQNTQNNSNNHKK